MTEENDINRAAPRRWLYGFNLVLLLVIGAIIIGLLMYMTANVKWKADLTSNGMYSLSGYTRQLLKQIDDKGEKYELVSLFPHVVGDTQQNENVQQVADLLDEYARASTNITYKEGAALGEETLKQEIRDRYADEIKPYMDKVGAYKKLADDVDKFSKAEAANVGGFSQAGGPKQSDQEMEDMAGLQNLFAAVVPEMLTRNKQTINRLTDSTSPDWERAVEAIKTAPPQRLSLPALEKTLALMANPAQVKEALPGAAAYLADPKNSPRFAAMHDKIKAYLDDLDKLKPLNLQDVLDLQPNTVLVLGSHGVVAVAAGSINKPSRVQGQPGQPPPTEFAGEEAISSALLGLVQPEKVKVVFITSGPTHPATSGTQDSWSDMADQLKQANFDVLEWNPPGMPTSPDELPSPPTPPAEGKGVVWIVFPPDVDRQAMMMGGAPNAGPVLQAVKAHMDADGQVLFLADADSGMTAMMTQGKYAYQDLIDPFGIQVHTKYVVEHNYPGPKSQPRPYPRVVVSRYENHDITKPLQSLQTVVMALQGRMGFIGLPTVVDVEKNVPSGVDAKVLMYAADDGDTWGETNLAADSKFDKGVDYAAPCPLAAASVKQGKDGEQRVVVLGSRTIGCNEFLEDMTVAMDDDGRITSATPVSPGNMELVRNSVLWLAGYKNMIAVGSKSAAAQRITAISPAMLVTLRTFLIAVMPLLALVLGGVVWLFRRR